MTRYEKEEDDLDRQLDRGEITAEQHKNELRLMRYEMRAIAEEEAENARRAVMDDYGY